MGRSVQLRAWERDGMVQIKAVIMHPMEDGRRKIKLTGKKIPPHFIREVVVSRNNRIVLEAFWGKAVSRNPYLSLEVPGRKGDRIRLSWLDNRGNSDSASIRVR